MIDLTKLSSHTAYPGFKNNRIYTGSFALTGTTSEGLNTITHTVGLDKTPDISDLIFNGPNTAYDSSPSTERPPTAWFKEGYVNSDADFGGLGTITTTWFMSHQIIDSQLIITAQFPQEFSGSGTLPDDTISYRLIDYSDVGSGEHSLVFDSRLNYMKRGFVGSEVIAIPASGVEFHGVNHNLGYIPFFIVGAEMPDDGVIWSNNLVFKGTRGGTGGETPPQLRYWTTEDTLSIGLADGFNGGEITPAPRDVYWVIYLDYQNS